MEVTTVKRIFLIVLDSCGAGAMPDAAQFGDVGVHTLRSCAKSQALQIPNLRKAGLGNIQGLSFLGQEPNPTGAVARLAEASMGKDTTIGHWEIAGVVSPEPCPPIPMASPGRCWRPSRPLPAGAFCAICPTPAPRSSGIMARSN